MKANEMYDQSVTASQGLPPKHELPTRLLNALRNAGFVEKQDGKEPRLKTNLLREAILDGTIWTLRNVGKTYVKLLSEHLEQIEQHEAPLKAGLKRAANDTTTTQATIDTDTIPEIPPPTKITHMIPAQPGWWAFFQTPEYRHSTAYRIVAWIARADPYQDPTALLAVKGWTTLIPTTDFKYLDGPGPFQTYRYIEPPSAPAYTG